MQSPLNQRAKFSFNFAAGLFSDFSIMEGDCRAYKKLDQICDWLQIWSGFSIWGIDFPSF